MVLVGQLMPECCANSALRCAVSQPFQDPGGPVSNMPSESYSKKMRRAALLPLDDARVTFFRFFFGLIIDSSFACPATHVTSFVLDNPR